MKQFLKFSGFIAFGLALLGFILFMATPAITYEGHTAAEGATAIFGKQGNLVDAKPSVLALIAWILILAGMILLAFMIIMMFVKKDFYGKFANLFNVILAIAFILAAILSFFTVPTFFSANGGGSSDGFVLGAGWIIGAILVILAGGLCLLPVVLKKK